MTKCVVNILNDIKIKCKNDCLEISVLDKVHILKKQKFNPVSKDSIPKIDATKIKLSNIGLASNKYIVEPKK